MPRFRKGTTDHDADGRMGGSMKEESAMAKKSEQKTDAASAQKPTGPTNSERIDAIIGVLKANGLSLPEVLEK